ncbi:MAG: winged helix-turn-helix domain-containing protein [Candidatus Hadarchaeales archaeon]
MEVLKDQPIKLEIEGEEWETLDEKKASEVSEALADPIRRWIYQELGKGSLRQAELAKKASQALGKKITNVLIRYHLNKLASAGLVRFEKDEARPRVKVVHRSCEVRIQVRPFSPPSAGLEEVLSGALRRRG